VGTGGTFLRSTDFGLSWSLESYQGGSDLLNAIHVQPNGSMGYVCGEGGVLLCSNGQSPGYTLSTGEHLDNDEFVERIILETRRGRRSTIDVIVWNILDYNLLWRFLMEMKAAHIKLYLISEIPFIMDYYYEYDPDFWVGPGGKKGIILTPHKGLVVNGRRYGNSMSRVVIGLDDLPTPQVG
jgi:hypothetical protein